MKQVLAFATGMLAVFSWFAVPSPFALLGFSLAAVTGMVSLWMYLLDTGDRADQRSTSRSYSSSNSTGYSGSYSTHTDFPVIIDGGGWSDAGSFGGDCGGISCD